MQSGISHYQTNGVRNPWPRHKHCYHCGLCWSEGKPVVHNTLGVVKCYPLVFVIETEREKEIEERVWQRMGSKIGREWQRLILSAREVARGVGYSEKRKCCSCWECKPLQNSAWRARWRKPVKLIDPICWRNVENNKRSSYRIDRKAAWETGQVCILSILPGKSPSHGKCSD